MKYSEILVDKFTDVLKCSVCGESLAASENKKSLLCEGERRHCFDILAKGYVNMALGHSGGGDGKDAVRSRTAFLNKGFYRPFADEICRILSKYVTRGGVIVDAGCGEGYYTSLASEICGLRAIGFDLSKSAVEGAAKSASSRGLDNVAYGVAGIFSMPLKDECADAVMNLFAPCAEEEFCRVLKRDGILLVAGAGKDHLFGFKSAIYDTPYKNELREDLPTNMEKLESVKVRFDITLDSYEDKMNLFAMTPYYYRTSKEDAEKLKSDAPIVTEVEFDIDIYRKR
jgi:23S rRNA (guanine745-N1)-methyltransferase